MERWGAVMAGALSLGGWLVSRRGSFAEDEELDECADEENDGKLADEEALGESQAGGHDSS